MTQQQIAAEHLETFSRVYREAKAIYHNTDGAAEHKPIDPVVRFEDRGENAHFHGASSAGFCWLIDSGLHSGEHTQLLCSLDDFDSWFFEAYQDADYEPSISAMREFASMVHGEDFDQ